MTDALAKHVARETAGKRIDAFFAGAIDKPQSYDQEGKAGPSMREIAEALMPPAVERGLPLETTLPTLRKLFWEVREAGAFIVPGEWPDEKREMLARPLNSLVADGLLRVDGDRWTLTELGVQAIAALDQVGHVSKIRNFVEPVLFPEGRPSRLALQAKLADVNDRAAEVQARLDEVHTYATLCIGRKQAPW